MLYIIEVLDEARILAIDEDGDVVNCSIFDHNFEPVDTLHCVPRLARYNFAVSLIEQAAPVTTGPEAMVAPL